MSIEAGVLVDINGQPIYWHVPPNRTVASLPDSRDLWDVIWENREKLLGFAHSHPGSGLPGPSQTDITTFVAVERALGRHLTWWITSEDRVVVCRRTPRLEWYFRLSELGYAWLPELRRLSYEP